MLQSRRHLSRDEKAEEPEAATEDGDRKAAAASGDRKSPAAMTMLLLHMVLIC